MSKINRFFLKCLSSDRLSERTKLLLVLLTLFSIGSFSILGFCLLLIWLRWRLIIVIIGYIYIYLILSSIKNKYRNNFWQFLWSIILLPKYLFHYFIYPTFIVMCSYICLIFFSYIPALFLINILIYIFKIKLLEEAMLFILITLSSIISVYGQKFIRWAIKKYSPLKDKGEYIFESFQEELALYVIHRSNIIFFIYLMYLSFLFVSNFIQLQYHSYLMSPEKDNVILKSFLVFIAFSNMFVKLKEVNIESKELLIKVAKLFIQGKQPKKDVENVNNNKNESLTQKS